MGGIESEARYKVCRSLGPAGEIEPIKRVTKIPRARLLDSESRILVVALGSENKREETGQWSLLFQRRRCRRFSSGGSR